MGAMPMADFVQTNPRAAASEKPAALLRQLGIVSATALVVSNMSGAGIFTSTGFLAMDLGAVGPVLLIWAVGAGQTAHVKLEAPVE